MFYKNVSSSVKTFHGVTFKPGETKEVNKYISDRFMIAVDDGPNEAQNAQQKPSSESKKEAPKKEPVKEEPKQIEAKEKPEQDKPAEPKS